MRMMVMNGQRWRLRRGGNTLLIRMLLCFIMLMGFTSTALAVRVDIPILPPVQPTKNVDRRMSSVAAASADSYGHHHQPSSSSYDEDDEEDEDDERFLKYARNVAPPSAAAYPRFQEQQQQHAAAAVSQQQQQQQQHEQQLDDPNAIRDEIVKAVGPLDAYTGVDLNELEALGNTNDDDDNQQPLPQPQQPPQQRFAQVSETPAPAQAQAPAPVTTATPSPTNATNAPTSAPVTSAPTDAPATISVPGSGTTTSGNVNELSVPQTVGSIADQCYKLVSYPREYASLFSTAAGNGTDPNAATDQRRNFAIWFDSTTNSMRMWGGCDNDGSTSTAVHHIEGCSRHIVEWKLMSNTWQTIDVQVENHQYYKVKTRNAAFAYNAGRNAVFDFGGMRRTSETGEFQPTNWLGALYYEETTEFFWVWRLLHNGVSTTSAANGVTVVPPPANDAALIGYRSDAVFLFGGYGSVNGSIVLYNDLWMARNYSNTWRWSRPKFSATTLRPAHRYGHTFTLLNAQTALVYGGQDAAGTVFNDMWKLTIPANIDTDEFVWTRVNFVGNALPRVYHAAVAMPEQKFMVVGGQSTNGVLLGDIAVFDYNTNAWLANPPSMANGTHLTKGKSMRATAAGNTMIVTGGCDDNGCQNALVPRLLDTKGVCPSTCINGVYEEVGTTLIPHCKCNATWGGKYCDKALTCPGGCGNRGTCVAGKCQCIVGYGGASCAEVTCPNNCTSLKNGECDHARGACVCRGTFWGLDCSERACPNNCNGHGICQMRHLSGGVENKCKCDDGYSGDSCQYFGYSATANKTDMVPYVADFTCRSNCNGHGLCVKKVTHNLTSAECVCEQGFTGVTCDGQCPRNCTSPLHGRCRKDASGTPRCECKPGFTGPSCLDTVCVKPSEEEGECSVNKGRGKCFQSRCFCDSTYSGPGCDIDTTCSEHGKFQNASCQCDPGYGGKSCETKITCKTDVPNTMCSGHGNCMAAPMMPGDTVPAGQCECTSAWTGESCNVRRCPNFCSGNGVCQASGQCACYPGFASDDCSLRLKGCGSNCTSGHGVCTVRRDGVGSALEGVCQCKSGWSGEYCAQKGCANDCYGRGQCEDGTCVNCADGYSGTMCEIMCPDKCNKKGKCVDGRCMCFPGHTGPSCNSTAECPRGGPGKKPCSGAGICWEFGSKCFCHPGFDGDACERRQNCGQLGCSNSGKCLHGQCFCDPGYEGAHCERRSACHGNCTNHGVCVGGKCICQLGFEGESCEKFTADATCPDNCNGHGICQSGRCFCASGYTGAACNENVGISKCRRTKDSKPCEGRGLCEFQKCFCEGGFAGEFCERKEVCEDGCIEGQGTCIRGKCVCNPGFKGVDCSEDLICPGSPNGVACSARGVCCQGQCACFPGYGGRACETLLFKTEECPKNCSGQGHCHMGRCYCIPGRGGPDCSMHLQSSCPNDCSQKGVCLFNQCFCKPGHAGTACERELTCSAKCLENGVCAYGKCYCVPGFTGVNCDVPESLEYKIRLYEKDVRESLARFQALVDKSTPSYCAGGCGVHGVCVNQTCFCQGTHYGRNCELRYPSVQGSLCRNNCTGHGLCVNNQCMCPLGRTGAQCQYEARYSCKDNCNSHGTCRYGKCYCEPGYKGDTCQLREECAPGCSEHGMCIRGQCKCCGGYSGATCNTSVLTTSSAATMKFRELNNDEAPLSSVLGLSDCEHDCGSNGLCVNKQCFCRPGFTGADCSSQLADGASSLATSSSSSLAAAVAADQQLSGAVVSAATSLGRSTDALATGATDATINTTAAASGVSHVLMSVLAFIAGLIVCVVVQIVWAKRKEAMRQRATKDILKPLLHRVG